MKITVVGTGYVGLVTGACFSEVGHDVLCVDNNEKKVAMLNRLEMPIYEDGLEPMVRKNVAEGRLRFTSSIKEGTDFAEVIFVAVGTPPGRSGEANLSYVEQVGREVAQHMTSYRLLVEKSTVPVNILLMILAYLAESERVWKIMILPMPRYGVQNMPMNTWE